MPRFFTKTTRRASGEDLTDTVCVEPVEDRVHVTSQDGSSRYSNLSRRASKTPHLDAARICGDLLADGYTER